MSGDENGIEIPKHDTETPEHHKSMSSKLLFSVETLHFMDVLNETFGK